MIRFQDISGKLPFRKAVTERCGGERGEKGERKEEGREGKRKGKEGREKGRKRKTIKKNLRQTGRGSSLANHGNQGLF